MILAKSANILQRGDVLFVEHGSLVAFGYFGVTGAREQCVVDPSEASASVKPVAVLHACGIVPSGFNDVVVQSVVHIVQNVVHGVFHMVICPWEGTGKRVLLGEELAKEDKSAYVGKYLQRSFVQTLCLRNGNGGIDEGLGGHGLISKADYGPLYPVVGIGGFQRHKGVVEGLARCREVKGLRLQTSGAKLSVEDIGIQTIGSGRGANKNGVQRLGFSILGPHDFGVGTVGFQQKAQKHVNGDQARHYAKQGSQAMRTPRRARLGGIRSLHTGTHLLHWWRRAMRRRQLRPQRMRTALNVQGSASSKWNCARRCRVRIECLPQE